MSRSYKKPYVKGTDRFFKNYANRIVRNFKGDIANGKSYRKLGPIYSISDYCFRMREDEEQPWRYTRK